MVDQTVAENVALRNREKAVEELNKIILNDRQNTHGNPEDNFDKIAVFWTDYLYYKYNINFNLDKYDVCNLMELLKMARKISSPKNLDNYLDGSGYSLIGLSMLLGELENAKKR